MKNSTNLIKKTWIIAAAVTSICFSIFVVTQLDTSAQTGRIGETRTVRFTDTTWSERVPFETLAAESTVIAIGVTSSNVCVPSTGPQAVDTVYQIRVTEIIRGNSGLNGLEVIMPGGLVREASGRTSDESNPRASEDGT